MSQSNLVFEQLEQSPDQETLNFEYGVLETEMRSIVQQHANEIKMLMRRSTQDIIDIGRKLTEVKKHLGHGNFRNWLKLEFNWSISTATKFMQVAEQFKCVNFKHLNITASTLYLLAAPSTPKEVRVEVLERASNGENIGYTEAKRIIFQYKKETKKGAVKPKAEQLKFHEQANVMEPAHYETSSVLFAQEDLKFEDKQIASTIENIPDDITERVISMENIIATSNNISDTAITEMAISITSLTPEQLAILVTEAVNNGLSSSHLSAIIMASQQALDTQP